MLFADDFDTESVKSFLETPLGVAAVVVGAMLVVGFLAFFSGRIWLALFGKAQPTDLQAGLRERLAEYPAPPGKPGPKRMTIEGVPARLRLVVMAPVGRSREIKADDMPELLNTVVRGLGEIARKDKPRLKVWPAQLSNTGFAPTFHRLTESPDAVGEPSYWVLLAGQALAAGKPILLGLAVLADEENELGQMTLSQEKWMETVRVVTMEE